jgi:hypothetical protein
VEKLHVPILCQKIGVDSCASPALPLATPPPKSTPVHGHAWLVEYTLKSDEYFNQTCFFFYF